LIQGGLKVFQGKRKFGANGLLLADSRVITRAAEQFFNIFLIFGGERDESH